MPVLSFDSLALVVAVAFLVPLLAGMVPRLRIPSTVLEIVAGIAIGPHGLGWASVDIPVYVFSLVGLAALLFLSGLEFDPRRLRGPRAGSIARAFLLSCGLALAIALGLAALHLVTAPVLVATMLASTSLGLVVPILKDAKQSHSACGELVIAGAALGEIGPLIFLSLVFAANAVRLVTQVVLLIGFVAAVGLAGVGIWRAERLAPLSAELRRLDDTTAQIRVRGVLVLLGMTAVAADHLGFENILGAFLAGAILSLVLRDDLKGNLLFRSKLDAIGYGVFIPTFFVASGMQLDIGALVTHASAAARVPIYLAALLVARAVPAALYRRHVGTRQAVAAGLLQATSLPFIVAAVGIAETAGDLSRSAGTALVAAGLLSALLFPLPALALLTESSRPAAELDQAPA